MKYINFFFDKNTKIAVEKVVSAYFGENISVIERNFINVFLVKIDEGDIFSLHIKFKLLDNRYDDYKEYGGYSDVTEEYAQN